MWFEFEVFLKLVSQNIQVWKSKTSRDHLWKGVLGFKYCSCQCMFSFIRKVQVLLERLEMSEREMSRWLFQRSCIRLGLQFASVMANRGLNCTKLDPKPPQEHHSLPNARLWSSSYLLYYKFHLQTALKSTPDMCHDSWKLQMDFILDRKRCGLNDSRPIF